MFKNYTEFERRKLYGDISDYGFRTESCVPKYPTTFGWNAPFKEGEFKIKVSLFNTFQCTRSFPPGDNETDIKATESFIKTITDPDTGPTINVKSEGFSYGTELLDFMKNGTWIRKDCIDYISNKVHISLSSTACVENSTDQGGKAKYLKEKFIKWITKKPPSFKYHFIPLYEFWIIEDPNVERVFTIVPSFKDDNNKYHHPENRTMMVSYDHVKRPFNIDMFGKPDPLAPGFTDSYFGNDAALGFQYFVFAYILLKEEGYLEEIDCTYSEASTYEESLHMASLPTFKDGSFRRTTKPFPATYSTIREPGMKSRGVTVTKAALILFLQPMTHILRAILQCDPV